jgi:glycine cleavage system H protein
MTHADLRYTKDHEWVRIDGDVATVGITEYAAHQLGDIVFVELPELGRVVDRSAPIGIVESVKAVSDLFAPVGGEVIEANPTLSSQPELVNGDPFGDGWMLKVRLSDTGQLDGLLDASAYDELIKEA